MHTCNRGTRSLRKHVGTYDKDLDFEDEDDRQCHGQDIIVDVLEQAREQTYRDIQACGYQSQTKQKRIRLILEV